MQKDWHDISPLSLALLFSTIFWVAESFIDAHFFSNGTFLTNLTTPPLDELWMRVQIIFLTFFIAYYSQRIINKHKEIAKKLLKNEAILEKAQGIAQIGSWSLNLVTHELDWSDEIYRIFGIAPNEFGATYEAFLRAVHPNDRERVKENVEKAIKEQSSYQLEHRILRPNNEVRIVLEQGEVDYDNSGRPVQMVGTVQDITEQKEHNKRFHLASLVFEHSLEGIFITDHLGNFQLVNATFTQITGYPEEEVLGKNASILKSGRHDENFYRNFWKELKEKGKWEGEIWNCRKNGEEYLQWHSITSLRDETGKVSRYLNFFTDITEKNEIETRLLHQRFHDALTGLANRSLFMDRLQKAIKNAEEESRILTIMFLGIDRFKNINDSLGHGIGDKLLNEVSTRLQELIDSEMTLARMGGDEFGFLLPKVEHEDDAFILARTILDTFRPPFSIEEQEIYITCSIGIGTYPSDGDKAETLIKNANTAMRRAKEQGKNNFQLYNPMMNIRATEMIEMERNLRKALFRDELLVFYQPKVNIKSGRLTGMEALIRWKRPEIGFVSPADFIPIAEETGLIILIGEWVLREACSQTKKWRDMGHQDLTVSVNLSAVQFMEHDLLSTVRSTLRETELPATCLDLELTESAIMNDVGKTIEILRNLSERGVSLSIDDFGTGYSSLSYLKRFPIHTLKIDQSFIREVIENEDDAAITAAVISLAKSLNLKVVAEGVEKKEQLDFLRILECDEIQGYYFSKPLPAAEFQKLLEEGKELQALG